MGIDLVDGNLVPAPLTSQSVKRLPIDSEAAARGKRQRGLFGHRCSTHTGGQQQHIYRSDRRPRYKSCNAYLLTAGSLSTIGF